MRISEASHHLKRTSLWENEEQTNMEAALSTSDILNKATTTIRASLGENNPLNIWEALGLHLRKQLMQHKAVNITDFGAFGFDQNGKPIFVQDPVFLHMTRLCSASRKRGNHVQPALSQSEDVVNVEMNELAAEYLQNCSMDLVKSVISSVLAWVLAWAKDGQEMRLSFLPIGEWICNGDSVDFRFLESFRKELEQKQAEEERARMAGDYDGWHNNQIEEKNQGGDQSSIRPLSARTIATTHRSRENLSDDISVATKSAATRNGSLVSRSRYKLQKPTFSSIAKQLPPHGQRRNRTEVVVKGASSSNKRKSSARTSSSSRAATLNGQQTFNPAEIEAVTNDIIAAVKNGRPVTASSTRTCKTNRHSEASSVPTAQQVETIDRLRKRISNRKCKLMQGLNAVVAVLSPFKTGAISSAELSLSLRKLGVKISSAELKEIATAFPHEKRGYINIHELLAALRGPLSAERLDLVARVFHEIDPMCSGFVHIDELVKHYDVSFLPQVRDGKLSRLEALTAFLQEWVCINTADTNIITFQMFAEYYHNVSACISNDDDFARLMYQAWHLPEENQEQGNQPPLDESLKNRPSSTSSAASSTPGSIYQAGDQSCPPDISTGMFKEEISPSEAWSYLRALLLFPYQYHDGAHTLPTLDNMCRRLGANRVLGDDNETMNVKAFANELMLLDKRLIYKKAFELSCFVASHCGKDIDDSDTIVLQTLYRMLMTTPNEESTTKQSWDYNYVEYYATRAIERIRARLKVPENDADNDSLVDLNTLEKWLQGSSSNGDSLLLKYELRSALQKVGIDISYQDLDYLFAYFDVERQGFINYEMFLEALRSPSSVLPKLTKRHKNSVTSEKSAPAPIQSPDNFAEPLTPQPLRRRKQVAVREPQPNYRRRNLIHRAIYDQTTRPTATDVIRSLDILEIERRRRYRAAQLIQTIFRGFRARHVVAQLRRKLAAKKCRVNALAQERQQWLADRKKVYRTALPTAYGF